INHVVQYIIYQVLRQSENTVFIFDEWKFHFKTSLMTSFFVSQNPSFC
ncbi:MAG: hypothetical protein ACI90V_008682, partial [Bacillariaceae sp.]